MFREGIARVLPQGRRGRVAAWFLVALMVLAIFFVLLIALNDLIMCLPINILEKWRNAATIIQSLFIVSITSYIFIYDRLRRRNDKIQNSLALLTIKSSGFSISKNDRSKIIISMNMENVGVRSVKLWWLEVRQILILDADCSATAEDISQTLQNEINKIIQKWHGLTFSIRTKESYAEIFAADLRKNCGSFICHLRVFFDHGDSNYQSWCEAKRSGSSLQLPSPWYLDVPTVIEPRKQ